MVTWAALVNDSLTVEPRRTAEPFKNDFGGLYIQEN